MNKSKSYQRTRLESMAHHKININKAILFVATVVFFCAFSSGSYAQRVTPMVFELDPIGSGSSKSLRIENTKEQSLTVEFVATKISLDEFGNESRTPADNDFLIYPPQALIPGGKTQIVKVRYIGDPTILESNAYRVSVNQLPVQVERGFQGVGVVVNFNTLVNVSPIDSTAQLSVIDIAKGADDQWDILIENKGNRFSRLSKTVWQVTSTVDTSNTKLIKKSEVADMTDKNLVIPNSTLRLSIPSIEGFEPSTTKISISTDI